MAIDVRCRPNDIAATEIGGRRRRREINRAGVTRIIATARDICEVRGRSSGQARRLKPSAPKERETLWENWCFLRLSWHWPLASPAPARLVSFDLIKGSSASPIPNGWASFDWSSNFYWINGSDNTGGYANGVVSPPNVAYNAYGDDVSFRRNTPFDLVSFYLTGAWNNGLEVTVTGFRQGVQVDSTTFTVNTSAPTLETLNWDVNGVSFHSFGGTSAGYDGHGYQFVLDNLTTMPLTQPSTEFLSLSGVPEPSTWAMMLLGFAGLGLVGYRRARTAAPFPD